MRCVFSVSVSMLLAASVMIAGGCATRQAQQTTLHKGDYQKLIEKQKAGMSVADEMPKNLPAMTAEDYEVVGDNYFRQGNFSLAFVQYNKALRMVPTASLRYKIGLVYLKRGLAKDARRAFQEILNADGTFALAHEGIGQALLVSGDIRKAETHFQRAITLDDSLWQSYNALGTIYDHQGHFDEAVAAYKAAMVLRKGDGLLLNNLGVSYHRKGDYDHAVRAFLKALNMKYAEAKVYNNLGLSLAKLGRHQEALLAFIKGGDRARAYNNLGVIYLTEGKYEKAATAFEKAMVLSPRYYATASENLHIARQALGAPSSSPDVPPSGSGERASRSAH